MVELAKITKGLPRRHQDLPTVSSRCHRMAGTERQFVPLQQNVQNVSAAFGILEREKTPSAGPVNSWAIVKI